MKLLIVEDDLRVSEYLEQSLTRENYSVTVCKTVGELETYLELKEADVELVILDRMLGREDGATTIKKIKTKFPEAGILILSSLDMASEKARILDMGADDYLAKPFSLDELSARLRLVQRRRGVPAENTTVRQLGDISVNLRTQQVIIKKQKIDLTKKEFQILTLLIEHPGRVYTRFQILDQVWQIESLGESNVVESTIKNLRKKLEEAESAVLIESKRNVGYWIEA